MCFVRRMRPRTPRKASISATEAGDRVIAGRRLRARQVITEPVLRREVSRDLEALLNAVAIESTIDMSRHALCAKVDPQFRPSRRFQSDHRRKAVDSIPGEIKTAIINYEPRLAGGVAAHRARHDASIPPSSRCASSSAPI